MSIPEIVLTSDLTSEVVEFWGFKYKEMKQELETLKVRSPGFKYGYFPFF
jgi:hypothetical protein